MEYLSIDDKLLFLEHKCWAEGFCFVGGVDEAGRGPLAGPVVAAAVVFPLNARIPAVNDSKQLTEEQRVELRQAILEVPGVQYGIAVVPVEKIDEINILQASRLAMRQAVSKLKELDFLLIDGLPVPDMPVPCEAIVKGDAKSASIAAASILAKVHRDELMVELSRQYPQYGFEQHKGYGTEQHLAALKKCGVCAIHRRTFAPVRDIITPPPEQLKLFEQ
ncbi:MAG: ribonuclease HII [Victivallaceae bacterium]